MTSMVFLLIPSTFVGIIDLYNLDVFKKFGPFYVLGLLLAGVSNIYTTLHGEIRHAAIAVVKYHTCKTEPSIVVVTTTTNASVYPQLHLFSVLTFYFGSTEHRTEHRVLNCSTPSTAPGTELLKTEHRAPPGSHRCTPVWCRSGACRNTALIEG